MDSVKTIIDTCTKILMININLFGYDITLMAVLVFGGCLFLLSSLIFGLFK